MVRRYLSKDRPEGRILGIRGGELWGQEALAGADGRFYLVTNDQSWEMNLKEAPPWYPSYQVAEYLSEEALRRACSTSGRPGIPPMRWADSPADEALPPSQGFRGPFLLLRRRGGLILRGIRIPPDTPLPVREERLPEIQRHAALPLLFVTEALPLFLELNPDWLWAPLYRRILRAPAEPGDP